MLSGFRHAAPFSYSEHDMKVAQSDAPPDAIRPIHVSGLSVKATGMSQNRASTLQPGEASFQSKLKQRDRLQRHHHQEISYVEPTHRPNGRKPRDRAVRGWQC